MSITTWASTIENTHSSWSSRMTDSTRFAVVSPAEKFSEAAEGRALPHTCAVRKPAFSGSVTVRLKAIAFTSAGSRSAGNATRCVVPAATLVPGSTRVSSTRTGAMGW